MADSHWNRNHGKCEAADRKWVASNRHDARKTALHIIRAEAQWKHTTCLFMLFKASWETFMAMVGISSWLEMILQLKKKPNIFYCSQEKKKNHPWKPCKVQAQRGEYLLGNTVFLLRTAVGLWQDDKYAAFAEQAFISHTQAAWWGIHNSKAVDLSWRLRKREPSCGDILTDAERTQDSNASIKKNCLTNSSFELTKWRLDSLTQSKADGWQLPPTTSSTLIGLSSSTVWAGPFPNPPNSAAPPLFHWYARLIESVFHSTVSSSCCSLS